METCLPFLDLENLPSFHLRLNVVKFRLLMDSTDLCVAPLAPMFCCSKGAD